MCSIPKPDSPSPNQANRTSTRTTRESEKQSTMYPLLKEIEGSRAASGDKPSAGPVYKSTLSEGTVLSVEGVSTLYDVFERSAKKYAENKCLGYRPIIDGQAGDFVWWNYKETAEKVVQVASALKHAGISTGDKVGVFSANCPEWMLAMQACNRMSYTCVPLYDSLGENAIEYIITHSESSAVFVAADKLPKLTAALPQVKEFVKVVIYWGDAPQSSVEEIKSQGFTVYSMDELLSLGKDNPADAVPPKAGDLCTIMYTSGTTGNPKGVMLTHTSVVTMMISTQQQMEKTVPFDETDVFMSYLPLAHIFDRSAEELFLYIGGSIGYWQGNINTLVDDIAALKPTMFVGVPRVFERIYARVMHQANNSGFVKKFLFNYGYSRKLSFMKNGSSYNAASPFFDSLVFSKIKGRLGGNVRLIVTGGAPIPSHTDEFLRVCFCCPVVQGYGLTETCAGSIITLADDITQMGTVGVPTPCTTFRLESVPEMNYDGLGDVPKGEILLKGPSVFSGYYKSDKQTEEVLEKDGWFHTGDIGTIVGNGAVKIIDRKKNIFKLAQGEYIAVEKVEEVYKKNSIVDQLWVYGNSFKSFLVAVVVPQEAILMEWAKANGVSSTFEELCKNESAISFVLESLKATGKEGKLKGFELIKAVLLDNNMFSVDNDLLTPTFKLKRPQLLQKYQAEVDAMYAAAE